VYQGYSTQEESLTVSERRCYDEELARGVCDRLVEGSASRCFLRPRRLARPRTPPFHGGNTGSNPVGDAIQFKPVSSFADSSNFVAGTSTGLSKP
jgi:hypothetical protein